MNEMVERVARAIAKREGEIMLGADRTQMAADPRELARAAIEAMREPTEGMLRQYFEGKARDTFVYHWHNGIDAALK